MAPAPHLRELIETVRGDTGSADPLDQLTVAARTAAELSELSDRLLGYYVDSARQEGRSWIEISERLGVTKQAAHKRFAGGSRRVPPLERLTDRARRSVEASVAAARDLGHGYVGTEHLLLGLFAEPTSVAARVLADEDITRSAVEAAIVSWVGRDVSGGSGTPGPRPPFTPKALHVFEHAERRAAAAGRTAVGTADLLLGLYGDDGGLAPDLLAEFGLDLATATTRIERIGAGAVHLPRQSRGEPRQVQTPHDR